MKTATSISWLWLKSWKYCNVVSDYTAVSYHFWPIINGIIFTGDNVDNNTHILHLLWKKTAYLRITMVLYVSTKSFCSSSHIKLIQTKRAWRKRIVTCVKKETVVFFFEQKRNRKRKDQSKMKLKLEIPFSYSLEYKKVW